jgi:hypothetical protein
MSCPRGVTVTRSCQYPLDESLKGVSGWVINAPDALVVGDGGEHVMRYLTLFVCVVITHGPLSRTGRLSKSVRRRVLSLLHTANSAQLKHLRLS